LTPELLWTQFPYLWHMAEPGSWPSIRDNGLLSTSALVDRYHLDDASRSAILAERRPECVTIAGKGMPSAVIRDQKPMSDGALRKCLEDGLTPSEWYRILNARTFFWLSGTRLRGLLGARAYRDRPQTVLTLETRSLVEAHGDRIELSPINSGSTIFNPVRRGRLTFQPIAEYDYAFWRKKRAAANAVVELIVLDGVPDIRDHVIAVHDAVGNTFTEVWRRPGAAPSIGP
jgi:hypothetical protein